MADIFYDDQADLGVIQDRHVAVLGYGSQGHAHALSLRDSGVDVRVGLPDGSRSRDAAAGEGLRVLTPDQACEESDLIMVLAPDHVQRALYAEAIAPSLVEGDERFSGRVCIRFPCWDLRPAAVRPLCFEQAAGSPRDCGGICAGPSQT